MHETPRLNTYRLHGILITSLIFVFGHISCAFSATRTIKAAVPESFPPQYSVDSHGQPQGFAIDTMNRIAKHANMNVEYQTYENWQQAHEALRSGQADIIPNMGITTRREEYALFTDPVETFPVMIFVRNDNMSIRDIKDLAGHSVAVVEANVGYTLLKDRTDIDLHVFYHWQDALFQLLAGKVDATVYPQPVLLSVARDAGVDHRIKTVGKPLKEIKRAIAVRKAETNLFQALQASVKKFTGTPEYHVIYQKWYGRPRPFLTPVRMWSFIIASIIITLLLTWSWQYHAQKRFQRKLLKELEEQTASIQKTEGKYRQLVDTMFEGIIRADMDGRIILVNQAAVDLFGYETADELIGLNMTDLYANPVQREQFIDEMVKLGRIENLHFHYVKKNGSTGLALCNIKWFRNEDGTIGGTEGLVRDITELKQMEHKLSLAQKLESVGQLAAGIAHEINTPMQYILANLTYLDDSCRHIRELIHTYSEAMQCVQKNEPPDASLARIRKLKEEEDSAELMQEISEAIRDSIEGTERVSEIVRAMKYFSHPNSNEKTPIDLNEAISTTVTIARNEWKYSADLETDLDPNLPFVMCYGGDINQVLLNLVVNAAHAVDEKYQNEGQKGKITITSRYATPYAEISIADTGSGIPESHHHQVFDPFFTTKEVGKGTGQGLAISYSIMQKHNGSISFTTKQGEGTTFTIRLPNNEA